MTTATVLCDNWTQDIKEICDQGFQTSQLGRESKETMTNSELKATCEYPTQTEHAVLCEQGVATDPEMFEESLPIEVLDEGGFDMVLGVKRDGRENLKKRLAGHNGETNTAYASTQTEALKQVPEIDLPEDYETLQWKITRQLQDLTSQINDLQDRNIILERVVQSSDEKSDALLMNSELIAINKDLRTKIRQMKQKKSLGKSSGQALSTSSSDSTSASARTKLQMHLSSQDSEISRDLAEMLKDWGDAGAKKMRDLYNMSSAADVSNYLKNENTLETCGHLIFDLLQRFRSQHCQIQRLIVDENQNLVKQSADTDQEISLLRHKLEMAVNEIKRLKVEMKMHQDRAVFGTMSPKGTETSNSTAFSNAEDGHEDNPEIRVIKITRGIARKVHAPTLSIDSSTHSGTPHVSEDISPVNYLKQSEYSQSMGTLNSSESYTLLESASAMGSTRAVDGHKFSFASTFTTPRGRSNSMIQAVRDHPHVVAKHSPGINVSENNFLRSFGAERRERVVNKMQAKVNDKGKLKIYVDKKGLQEIRSRSKSRGKISLESTDSMRKSLSTFDLAPGSARKKTRTTQIASAMKKRVVTSRPAWAHAMHK
eukprot:CAMPEP_0115040262 /NCGR_PEP_ID=MMETSP0216-20121206/44679_1 /TAXON_ID=223996 /ORGANISM="Protocruzia adherens, Strain Boccale" /LENGTH=597 /DNA_ID=CAMNT_0002421379 /DNA_START=145 /DNA_END=1938 /DNA_ORIENTATION=-